MAIDQPPEMNLKDPYWWFPILEWLVEGKLPSDQTEARLIAAERKNSSSSTANSTNAGLSAYSCGVSSGIKAVSCCKRYMPAPTVTTLVQEHLSENLSNKDSISPQRSLTQRISCGTMKDASSTLDKLISWRRRCRPSPSRGLSLFGTSTWWGHSDKRSGASPTFS
jgi:hypothetical protein